MTSAFGSMSIPRTVLWQQLIFIHPSSHHNTGEIEAEDKWNSPAQLYHKEAIIVWWPCAHHGCCDRQHGGATSKIDHGLSLYIPMALRCSMNHASREMRCRGILLQHCTYTYFVVSNARENILCRGYKAGDTAVYHAKATLRRVQIYASSVGLWSL